MADRFAPVTDFLSSMREANAGVSYELDPDHLEDAPREALDNQDQPELPSDA